MNGEVLGLLREITRLLQRLVAATEHPLPARATTALRRGRGMKYLRAPRLLPHGQAIASWLEEGKTQVEIARILADQGVRTSRAALGHFIRTRLALDGED
ncbi:MAG: hypothetical protein ABSD47_09885 [Candidatus Methylomirabilota bacterium]|jgi:hypothetical protein